MNNSPNTPKFMKLNLNTLLCAASMVAILPTHAQAPAKEAKIEKSTLKISQKTLLGYWAPDEVSLRTQLLEKVKPLIAQGTVKAEMITEQAKQMANVMIINYAADGTSSMHTPAGPKKSTYEITAIRAEKSQLDITITSLDAGVEKGIITFKTADKLMLTQVSDQPGPKMNIEFNKLNKEVAEARIKANTKPATKPAPAKAPVEAPKK